MHESKNICLRLSQANMTDKAVGNENEAPKEVLDLNDLSSITI